MFSKKIKNIFSLFENKYVACVVLFIISSILLSWLSYWSVDITLESEGKPIIGGILGVLLFIFLLSKNDTRKLEINKRAFSPKVLLSYSILLLIIPFTWLLNKFNRMGYDSNFLIIKLHEIWWFVLFFIFYAVTDKFIFKTKSSKKLILVFPVMLFVALFLGYYELYPEVGIFALLIGLLLFLGSAVINVFVIASIKKHTRFLLISASLLAFEFIQLLGFDNNLKLDLNLYQNMLFMIVTLGILISTVFILRKKSLIEYLLLQKIVVFITSFASYLYVIIKNHNSFSFYYYLKYVNPFWGVEILVFVVSLIYIFRGEIKLHFPQIVKFINNSLGPFPFNVMLYFFPFIIGFVYLLDLIKGEIGITISIYSIIVGIVLLITLILLWMGKRLGVILQMGVIIISTILSLMYLPFDINLYLTLYPFAIYELVSNKEIQRD